MTWPDSRSEPLVGMGCMRLSTERDRDDARAIAVLHAAFDAGVNFLDTADVYCVDHTEIGHNERLIANGIATWPGGSSRIIVATKGGLTRPQGAWVPDGRARHLAEACEASRRALGVDRLPLYQLHTIDPRTPLSTSVRALDALKRDGRIGAIGLCNVTVGQIEEARGITEIAAVQVEISVWQDGNILSGVAAYCVTHGLRLIASRPLGGASRRRRLASDPVLRDLASRHGATPEEIALAWVADLSDVVLTIPGPSQIETAASIGRAQRVRFSGEDRARLGARFPSGRILRTSSGAASPPVRTEADGEVVLIMGLPGAGKSTLARTFVEKGYARLNRDEQGKTLRDLIPSLDRLIDSGSSRIVLDNTYVTRKSRAPVILAAVERGMAVRCVWLTTSVEDAQINAASRMLLRHGRLLEPEEIRRAVKKDVSAFGPGVQFRYQRELEPPHPSEGFTRVETVPFVRIRDQAFDNRALIVWCDGILRPRSDRPDSPDVNEIARRGALLRQYEAEGWTLCGLSWHPEIAAESASSADVEAGFERMQAQLGVRLDPLYCPHAAGPPVCWCRKPLPGLGVMVIERHKLDPSRCVYVGDGPQDPGFARRFGFEYQEAARFFMG
jgi:aryl-alcohol dehydrogenase-like predicted oxidoreductase